MSPTTLRRQLEHSLDDMSPDATSMAALFEAVGWPPSCIGTRSTLLTPRPVLLLSLAGLPQVAVARTTTTDDAPPFRAAVAVGYSSEARYTLEWGLQEVRLLETSRWRSEPGDFALAESPVEDLADLQALLLLISPEEVAAAGPSSLVEKAPKARAHLADTLATALAQMRSVTADSAAIAGAAVGRNDLHLLRLFHRLLFIRFYEDRHASDGFTRVEDLLSESDPRAGLEGLLAAYQDRHNSELFDAPALAVTTLPVRQLRELLQALTKPWNAVDLDFGLTHADIAGRLYQSYLRQRPAAVRPASKLFPEARKTDERATLGAYYTPAALARRLVNQTLEPWLARVRPPDPSKVRVLDPACGSGAFLVAAFRILVEYFEHDSGRPLAAAERRAILLQSIFGVDVDPAAALLVRSQLLEEADLQGRLPEMANNVRIGDSLLAPPSYKGSPEDEAIDWSTFGGSFDVIATNPPFHSQLAYSQRAVFADRRRLNDRYPKSSGWGVDVAYRFVDLSLQLLSDSGTAGFVLPRKVLRGKSAAKVRDFLRAAGVSHLTDYRGLHLFPGVSPYIATLVVAPGADMVEVEEVTDSRVAPSLLLDSAATEDQSKLASWKWSRHALRTDDWTPFSLRWEHDLQQQIGVDFEPLGGTDSERTVVHGTQTGANDRFVVREDAVHRAGLGAVKVAGLSVPESLVPRYARATSIHPFRLGGDERLVVPFTADAGRSEVAETMTRLVEKLGGMPANPQPGNLGILLGPKVILRAFGRELAAASDGDGTWITTKGTGGGLAIGLGQGPRWRLDAATTLLNSSLYQWLLRGLGEPRSDETVEVLLSHVERLPWPSLKNETWRRLANCAQDVLKALKVPDPLERTALYWQERWRIDGFVFESLAVGSRLQAVVTEELIRPA